MGSGSEPSVLTEVALACVSVGLAGSGKATKAQKHREAQKMSTCRNNDSMWFVSSCLYDWI